MTGEEQGQREVGVESRLHLLWYRQWASAGCTFRYRWLLVDPDRGLHLDLAGLELCLMVKLGLDVHAVWADAQRYRLPLALAPHVGGLERTRMHN